MNANRLVALKIRRRWRRKVCNNLFLISEYMPGRYQIGDISPGGLSYHYIGNGSCPYPYQGAYEIKVGVKDQSLSLSLFGRTIADNEVGVIISEKKTIRRRSIRFEPLNSFQKKKVKDIMKKHIINKSFVSSVTMEKQIQILS